MQPHGEDRPAMSDSSQSGALPVPGQPPTPSQPSVAGQPQSPFPAQTAFPPQAPSQPMAPPQPRPPVPRRTGRRLVVGVAVVLVLLVAGIGTALWTLSRHKPASPGSSSTAGPATWGVGSCIWLAKDFPYPTPSVVDKKKQQMIDAMKQYEPIACTDSRAIAKITALGAVAHGNQPVTDTGCPDDTDMAVRTTGKLTLADAQIYCTRNLKAPHPGDPGGGGGGLVVNDCVWVGSSDGARVLNDEVEETRCGEGAFARLLARTRDKAACPAGSLSRIPLGDPAGTILCLGQGGDGLIAKPGDCLWTPANTYRPAMREDCGRQGSLGTTLVAMADSAAQCPSGTHGRQYSGYDRWLCVRYADGS